MLSLLFNNLFPLYFPSQLKSRFCSLLRALFENMHINQMTLFLGRSMEIGLPEGFPSLSYWLYNQTDTVLQGLVKQGDPQQVIEYSLALITILNEVKQHSAQEGPLEALATASYVLWTGFIQLCRKMTIATGFFVCVNQHICMLGAEMELFFCASEGVTASRHTVTRKS